MSADQVDAPQMLGGAQQAHRRGKVIVPRVADRPSAARRKQMLHVETGIWTRPKNLN